MKRQIWILFLAMALLLPACGHNNNNDNGRDPEINSASVYNVLDHTQTPIFEAFLGDQVGIFVCIFDADKDAVELIVSQYFPAESATPYYDPISLELNQTQYDQCFNFEPFEILGPPGFWLVRFEIRDSNGNLSLPYDIDPFRVF